MPRQSSQKSGGSSPKKQSAKVSSSRKEPDALDFLKADHETVLTLFRQHPSASPEDQPLLAKQIFQELELHAAVEEELFYPALQQKGSLSELGEFAENVSDGFDAESVAEEAERDEDETIEIGQEFEEGDEDLITLAYEDHRGVKELIQELRHLDPASDRYRDRFQELKETVTEHMEEEEDIVFAEARLSVDTEKLGADIVKRRTELASSMAA